MKPARIAVIGVALAAGLLAAYLSSGGREPVQILQAPAEQQKVAATEVLVAAVDLPLGMKVGPADLKWLAWPSDGIGNGMILKKDTPDAVSQFVGSFVREAFLANEPLRKEKLVKTDAGFLAAILPQGKRAFAISIDQRGANTGGNLILPNDRVDVIQIVKDMQATKAVGADVMVPVTLLQNIRVLAIGPNLEEKAGERVAAGETATLELDPQQVTVVALAARTSSLTLALRSVADRNAPDSGAAPDSDATNVKQYSIIRFGVMSTTGRN